MSEATHNPAPNRRALLCGIAGIAVVAAAPTQAASPDAELIRFCEDYVASVAVFNAAPCVVDFDDDPLCHAVNRASDGIDAHPPTTLEGIVAKARAAFFDGDDGCAWHFEIVASLVQLYGERAA